MPVAMLKSVNVWIWVVIASLLSGAAGWLLANALRRRNPSDQRLRQMEGVLDRFQGEVAQHFQESADLITRLRTDVESLYNHLEKGATRLTTEDAIQTRLRELEEDSGTQEGNVRR